MNPVTSWSVDLSVTVARLIESIKQNASIRWRFLSVYHHYYHCDDFSASLCGWVSGVSVGCSC